MTGHLTRRVLEDARAAGYAVPAVNVVDELGMDAVLATAARLASPVVVQMSERAARFWRPGPVRAGFVARRAEYGATAVLHLDHSTDRELLMSCLASGWESALFDASRLPFAKAVADTAAVVAGASDLGADIEGEFEPIGRLSDDAPGTAVADAERCQEFVTRTGVAALSPDLGTRHGLHPQPHTVDPPRAARLSRRLGLPLVLHGASRLAPECLREFVHAGVAKVNVSSSVKAVYAEVLTRPVPAEPLALHTATHTALSQLCADLVDVLGSGGRV
jgi:fructose-bisphosphate aldolase class II